VLFPNLVIRLPLHKRIIHFDLCSIILSFDDNDMFRSVATGLLLLELAFAMPEAKLSTSSLHRRKEDASANPIGASNKRGLLHIVNADYHRGIKPERDLPKWTVAGGDISWYYNYKLTTTIPDAPFPFVPMVWGRADPQNLDKQLKNLTDLGMKPEHVLWYNEPDQKSDVGGSNESPKDTAKLWKQFAEDARTKHKVKIGAPGTSGSPQGLRWLKEFASECKTCNIDFVPFHWYGGAPDLAAHLKSVKEIFPNKPLWVTEYNPPWRKDKTELENWFKNVTKELDADDAVERYSYWGAFRKNETFGDHSPDTMMLNEQGKYTKIGGWYMNKQVESAGSKIYEDMSGLYIVGIFVWVVFSML
jgi:hypothetical protein